MIEQVPTLGEMAEKIISDINTAFLRHPQLEEFDVIPLPEQDGNRSPVVVERNKLGLELWCLKFIYEYSYQRFVEMKKSYLPTATNDDETIFDERILAYCRVVLMVNANDAGAWNFRKAYFSERQRSSLSCWENEMRFCALVLKKHPKSSEAFWHRKWLILRRSSAETSFPEPYCPEGESFLNEEMSICEVAADRYASNYNAWTYRVFLLERLRATPEFLSNELAKSRDWVAAHVSDSSGFHYRQFLISRIAQLTGSPFDNASRLNDELQFISGRLMQHFAQHEAVWSHRKYVLVSLTNPERSSTRTLTIENERRFLTDVGIELDANKTDNLAFRKYENWFDKFIDTYSKPI